MHARTHPCSRQLALPRAPGACVRVCWARWRVRERGRAVGMCVGARQCERTGVQQCRWECVRGGRRAGGRACGRACGCACLRVFVRATRSERVYVCASVQVCGEAGRWVRWRWRERGCAGTRASRRAGVGAPLQTHASSPAIPTPARPYARTHSPADPLSLSTKEAPANY